MKNPLYRVLSALTALFLVAGCSHGTRMPIASEDAADFAPNAESANEGYLVGSFAATGKRGDRKVIALTRDEYFIYPAYGFYLRKIDGEDAGLKADIGLKRQNLGFSFDYRLKDGIGHAFAIQLPAGKYEFFQYVLDDGAKKWKPRKPYSVVIEIKAGRSLYIGETVVHTKYKESVTGADLLDGGYFTSSDQLTRDRDILYKKYPFLATIPMDMAILGPGLEHALQ